MSVATFNELLQHVGHNIVCVVYRKKLIGPPVNVALECVDCNEVLLSFDQD